SRRWKRSGRRSPSGSRSSTARSSPWPSPAPGWRRPRGRPSWPSPRGARWSSIAIRNSRCIRNSIALTGVAARKPSSGGPRGRRGGAWGAGPLARGGLAEVEHRRDVLLAELPKLIAYYDGQIRMHQALLKVGGIDPTEAKASIAKDSEELRRAKERLAAA